MPDVTEQLRDYLDHVIEPVVISDVVDRTAEAELIGADMEKSEQTKLRGVRALVLAAAALIAVVVLAVVLFADSESSSLDVTDDPSDRTTTTPAPPVFSAETAMAIIDDYFAARNAGDIEATFALFFDDAVVDDNFSDPQTGRTEWAPEIASEIAEGSVLVDPDCSVADEFPGQSVEIECRFGTLDALRIAFEDSPITTTAHFTVVPNGIRDLRETYGRPDFTMRGIPFNEWLEDSHPEVADEASCCAGGDTVEEAIRRGQLHAEYAKVYAAEIADTN